jgi:hypothetical protein
MIRQRAKHFFYNLKSRLAKYDYESLNKIFAPEYRGAIHSVFVWSLVMIVPLATGVTVARILLRKFPQVKTIPLQSIEVADLGYLGNYKLFHTSEDNPQAVVSVVTDDKSCEKGGALPSSIADRISLVSTLVLQDRRFSIVALQLKAMSIPNYLREGDQLEDLITVRRIEFGRVTYKNKKNDRCEYLENTDAVPRRPTQISSGVLPVAVPPAVTDGNALIKKDGATIIIDKKFRDDAIKNMTSILGQAKAEEITNADGTKFFRMTQIVPGSIYSQLNVENGDIITAFDGKRITDIKQLMSIFRNISKLEMIRLTISKNGTEQEYTYKIQ